MGIWFLFTLYFFYKVYSIYKKPSISLPKNLKGKVGNKEMTLEEVRSWFLILKKSYTKMVRINNSVY